MTGPWFHLKWKHRSKNFSSSADLRFPSFIWDRCYSSFDCPISCCCCCQVWYENKISLDNRLLLLFSALFHLQARQYVARLVTLDESVSTTGLSLLQNTTELPIRLNRRMVRSFAIRLRLSIQGTSNCRNRSKTKTFGAMSNDLSA